MALLERAMAGGVALVSQDGIDARDLGVDERGGEDGARHGVEGGRRPQRAKVVESAQKVRHVQEVGPQAVARPPDSVDPLEGLVRRPDDRAPLARRPLPEGAPAPVHLPAHDPRRQRPAALLHVTEREHIVQGGEQAGQGGLRCPARRTVQGSVAVDQHGERRALGRCEGAAVVPFRAERHDPGGRQRGRGGAPRGATVHRGPPRSAARGGRPSRGSPPGSSPPTRPGLGAGRGVSSRWRRGRRRARYPRGGRRPP